ncbi:Gfo/Idh/MocA family oxidoreductase [Cytophagaceae bacterium ABcell3]|nr:Gfo/Idh/MocA family oxidoreductase [Cytophagaceae bacterium ABcell3]
MVYTENIKFAVIGCGHIGKRHAAMISHSPEAELVALCDIQDPTVLNLDTYSHIPFFASIDTLLESNIPIDVLCICTPNGLHIPHAQKALDKKIHVVVEKPLGLTASSCQQLISKAQQVERQIFCVMQNRYSPPSVWLKEVVESDKLGEIFMVQINCYWNRDERYYSKGSWHGDEKLDGGTLFTQFSHFIDIMFWLFGDIDNIQARIRDFNHQQLTDFEDSGFVSFDFVNGGIGTFNFSTSVYNQNLESSMTIIGQNGSIKVGGQYMNEVEYCKIKDYSMPELQACNPPNDYGAYKGSAANHHFIIKNVIDTLKGRAVATTNATEGYKVVDIIERIYRAR